MPWATMLPVSVVVPKSKIWPTAPLPVAVWLPAVNRAMLPPPGAVVPTVQLAGSVKSVLPGAGCHSKAPETLVLVTSMVAAPERAAVSVTVIVIWSAAVPRAW